MTTLEEFNLAGADFKPTAFETYRELRAERPVEKIIMPDGGPLWLVTRYDDVISILKDERYVKNFRNAMTEEQIAGMQADMMTMDFIHSNMLFTDGADHTRLRNLVSKGFTPRHIEALRPRIEAIAAELLDAMADKETVDLLDDYAFPLPITVISEMLGVPQADQEQFRVWSNLAVNGDAMVPGNQERIQGFQAFGAYIFQLVETRRANPQDDLISILVQANEDGDRLNQNELIAMIFLLIVAGHETTVNLIANGVRSLLTNPDQLALLKAQPELMKSAIEEFLRFEGPVETSTMRFAREDLTLHGEIIKRGERVLVVLNSADRDETHFANPDDLDITRQIKQHLAFGHGIHYCLGAPLARMEGQIAIGRLLERYPDLELAVPADELEYRGSMLIRGLAELPIRLNAK